MGRLDDRTALVTGAGKGLGRAFCRRLAEEGANIVAVTRADKDGLTRTAEDVRAAGREVLTALVDVTSEEDTLRIAREAHERFGRLDILINNAAFYYGVERMSFDRIPLDQWDRMMLTNVKGPWLCARAVFPIMREQAKAKSLTWDLKSSLPAPKALLTTLLQRRRHRIDPSARRRTGAPRHLYQCRGPGLYRHRSEQTARRRGEVRYYSHPTPTSPATRRSGRRRGVSRLGRR